ncbi:MAG: hypothetical protein NTW21_40535 [Verrucomicrobia bacterium]|nr:hypothetical protein [Verrucomicrobiota bacterium]
MKNETTFTPASKLAGLQRQQAADSPGGMAWTEPPLKNESTFIPASKLAGPTAAASCTQSTGGGLAWTEPPLKNESTFTPASK